MKKLCLAKADPVSFGDDPIEPVEIHINDAVPHLVCDSGIDTRKYKRFYDQQAEQLADALAASLPGGTLDALLGELLARKATIFRVPLYGEYNSEHNG